MEPERKRQIVLLVGCSILICLLVAVIVVLATSFTGSKSTSNSTTEKLQPAQVVSGAVVSDHEVCSDIGRDILARHGSAVDAAIATLICCGVRVPQSMGLGGGSFMLVYEKDYRNTTYIDGREMAPHSMTPTVYQNLTNHNARGRTIGIPGELKAYKYAHDIFGRLPWSELFEPTIAMVKDAFPVADATYKSLRVVMAYWKLDNLTSLPYLCNLFCSDKETGEIYNIGDNMTWPNMAETLQGIADEGPDYIYNAKRTYTLVDEIKETGGQVDMEDFIMNYKLLHGYSPSIKIRNHTIYFMPGATGGPMVMLILNILKEFKDRWDKLDTSKTVDKARIYHEVIEAMKFGMAQHITLEDPAFNNLSKQFAENMTTDDYAKKLRSKITNETHEANYYTDNDTPTPLNGGTSHLSVLSPYGDAVSVTSTLNFGFGSKIVSSSTGIIWNNELDDFTSQGSVNLIAPLKRPRSSMCPVIVVDSAGNVKLVTGAAGGSKITGTVAQILVNIFLLDMPLDEAVDAKRFQGIVPQNNVRIERGFEEGLQDELRRKGHTIQYDSNPVIYSSVQSILVNNGEIKGYADPRKIPGKASYTYK